MIAFVGLLGRYDSMQTSQSISQWIQAAALGLLLLAVSQNVFGQAATEPFTEGIQEGSDVTAPFDNAAPFDGAAPFEGAGQADNSGFEGIDLSPEIDFDIEGMEAFGDEDFTFDTELTPEEAAAGAAMFMAMLVAIGIMSLIGFAMVIWVAYSMMDALSALPEQYRELSPAVPWLLLVPLVNIVVLFLVFIKVPDSLKAFLEANGDTAHGDCGRSNGLIGSILYIIGCTFPIGLVLLVMSLLKISQAKQTVRQFTGVA